MCWKEENELYNNGGAFKVTCRDDRGVVVTDNCRQLLRLFQKRNQDPNQLLSANLFGLVEEEHSGGAIAYPRGVMGDIVDGSAFSEKFGNQYSFEGVKAFLGDRIEVKPNNYAVDKKYPKHRLCSGECLTSIPIPTASLGHTTMKNKK